eukprot:CAMPEP_0197717678 /NCGR_PEP_ID=MMETSP1434-20131217/2126_1 /TAXON_ID=265543 /ORGANISM="Minutocellus polymorphus, Strain CCMP3303" /LENGTH=428 /DNA_ID=CAMNT_0043302241 /DNA_START=82 /DNA_END=1368 /DNA_ORIENTATION=+
MKIQSILSLMLIAGALGQKEGKPERCVDDALKKYDDVNKREALCNGSSDRYRLGINEYRRFALWDDDKMVELFAKQGDDLSIHEESGGKRVSLTLTDKYDDVVWQIKCSGLDGGSAKLQVRDSSSSTVRFRQGSTDLWTVDRYGDDDINQSYCEYDTSGGGGGSDRCDDKDNWAFSYDKNKDKCFEYCFDDNNEKIWKEVDCKDDGDRCDDDKNWSLKWNDGKEKCYKWCKTDDGDVLDEQVNDSECHKCDEDGPWDYSFSGGKCYAYCFNTPSGKKDSKLVDERYCDDKPSGGDEHFLAANKASYGDLCIKGASRTRLRPCDKGDSKQLWELTKNDQLVTKKDPSGCLYVDDNALGELVRYDDDCSSSRKYSTWKVTGSGQIQLMDDPDYCLTYDAPSMSPPDNKDKMILRYCKNIDRFQYDLEKKK